MIGVGLRVSDGDLEYLAQVNISNQRRLYHVLQKWIELDIHVTWKMIIDVVRGPFIRNNSLAKKIFQYLKQTFSEQQKATSKYINDLIYSLL